MTSPQTAPEIPAEIQEAIRRALRECPQVDDADCDDVRLMVERIAAIARAHGQQEAREPVCVWTEDEDGIQQTSCGKAFVFDSGGTPADHGLRFCGYCGHAVASAVAKEGSRR